MPHYLITGGAGFIGSNLIRHLFAKEKDLFISCIDNFDLFYPRAIKELNISDFKGHQNFQLLEQDISKIKGKELAAIIPKPVNTIIHLAAKAGVRPSIADPLGYQQANVIGLQNLLDFANEKNIKQFI